MKFQRYDLRRIIFRRLLRGRCGLKYYYGKQKMNEVVSPSARKVWIEIITLICMTVMTRVAFCEEGVD